MIYPSMSVEATIIGSLVSGRPASESADGTTCIDWNTDPQPAVRCI